MIRQLGFLPPRPAAIARIAGWRLSGRATRAADAAIQLCAEAAEAVAGAGTLRP